MAGNTIPTPVIDDAVNAHGGRDRWLAVTSLSAPVSIGGSLWPGKGHDGAFADAAVFIDPHRQHVEFSGFGPRRLRTWFEPDLVSVRAEDGTEIDRRRDPRASFPQDVAAPWDNIQVAYFASYAIWNYLTLPYLLTTPGIHTAEIEPWLGADSSWRRLSADFAEATVDTHNRLQYYSFDSTTCWCDTTTTPMCSAGRPPRIKRRRIANPAACSSRRVGVSLPAGRTVPQASAPSWSPSISVRSPSADKVDGRRASGDLTQLTQDVRELNARLDAEL
jgi:hypothetical protein